VSFKLMMTHGASSSERLTLDAILPGSCSQTDSQEECKEDLSSEMLRDVEEIVRRHAYDLNKCLEGWIQHQAPRMDSAPSAMVYPAPSTKIASQASVAVGNGSRINGVQMEEDNAIPGRVVSDDRLTEDSAICGNCNESGDAMDVHSCSFALCLCGNALMPDAKFCRACGRVRHAKTGTDNMQLVCSCGNVFASDASFCRKCGKKRARKSKKRSGQRKSMEAYDAVLSVHYLGSDQNLELEDRTMLQRITHSLIWEWASAVLIMVNCAFIGFETQAAAMRAMQAADAVHQDDPSFVTQAVHQHQEQEPTSLFIIGILFTLIFTVELLTRWVADGFWGFFYTSEWTWNFMDTVVLVFSLVDSVFAIMEHVADSEAATNMNILQVFRVLRVMRVVKIARVIRVMRFFRELRIMIYSIMRSMKSLLWVFIVLALLFYIFSITFCKAALSFLRTSDKWNDEKYKNGLALHFGSMWRSWLSLLMAMSGGNDWALYYEALEPLHDSWQYFFIFFIVFSIFAVANIVTAVFVDAAKQSSLADRAVLVSDELESKKQILEDMRKIFDEMDEDETGHLSMAEFVTKLGDERVLAYFNSMKLDVSDATTFFQLLDHDNSGEVSIVEFIQGCHKFMGESRRTDTIFMQYELQHIRQAICELRYLFDISRDPTASQRLHDYSDSNLSKATGSRELS